MTDLNIDGMAIAPGVVETIISMATRDIDGVASVGDPTTSGIMSVFGGGKPSTQGIDIETGEDDELTISIRLYVKSGYVLSDLAAEVRQAVADAIETQIGAKVAAVDIYIDGIQFDN